MGAVLRYFYSTPLFALLAGMLLVWYGEDVLLSRWSPATLALTHLFTLGALGMSMFGALIQILPVVAGIELGRVRQWACAVHGLLGSGTLALAGGFLSSQAWLFSVALVLLVPALLWLGVTLALTLRQPHAPGAHPMTATLKSALAALLITVVLGTVLASPFAWPGLPPPLPLMLATDLHAMWGILGWGSLLLAGVAFQVVPMFQVTAPYPGLVMRFMRVAAPALLVAVTLAAPMGGEALPLGALLVAYGVFAGTTLWLLARRKRPEPDAMTLFWRLAMLCLAACPLLWAIPSGHAGAGRPLALGMLAIVGFLYSTINGMLYKIVPFLVWHHLQEQAMPGQRAPSVKHIIPDSRARAQFWLQAATMGLLLAACWHPGQLARAAGLALAASALWLAWNLGGALRIYRSLRRNC
jgi:hypothetical protein